MILALVFGFMVGVVPGFTVVTLATPGVRLGFRVLLGLFAAAVGVALALWAASAFHNGWVLGLYVLILFIASIVCLAFLVVRGVLQLSKRPSPRSR